MSIYTVGGTVQAGSGHYIERAADAELLALCRASAFAYVLNARQMGKSSLVAHVAALLAAENTRTALIDLTEIGTQLTAEQWYLGLLVAIAERLELATDPLGWWQAHAHLGLTQRFTGFLQEVALAEVPTPIVIFIDEIDTTLDLDFTDDFYAAIRALYNARAQRPDLARLTFVLIGVATPGDLIKDPQRTPFNIGRQVELEDFRRAEVQPFAAGLGLPPEAAQPLLDRVYAWTHGHPYLTQRLCQMVADQVVADGRPDVDQLVETIFLGPQSQQDNHLQFVRDMLTRRAPDPVAVLATYRAVLRGRPVRDDERSPVKTHLKLAGAVRRAGPLLHVRNRIYAAAFDERWVREHMPRDYWPRRLQRGALVLIAILAVGLVLLGARYLGSLSREAELQAQRDTAVAAQATATVALGQADTERQRAVANQAAAEAAQQTAVTAREISDRLRQDAEVQTLALRAQAVPDPELGLLLAIEAGRRVQQGQIADRSGVVERALRQQIRASRIRLVLYGHQGAVNSVSLSDDGRRAVTAGDDGTARIWDASSGRLLVTIRAPSSLDEATFSPDGRLVLTVSRQYVSTYSPLRTGHDGSARLWDAMTGQELARLGEPEHSVVSAAFSADSQFVVTAGADRTARVWRVADASASVVLRGHTWVVESAVFSPNGRQVLTIGDQTSQTARLWDARSGRQIALLDAPSSIGQAVFSYDGALVVGSDLDGLAYVWRSADGVLLAIIGLGRGSSLGPLRFSSDGSYTLTLTRSGAVALWSAEKGTVVANLIPRNTALSRDGRLGATWDDRGVVQVWDTGTDRASYTLRGHSGQVLRAAFSPDSQQLATAGSDGTARIWSAASATTPTLTIDTRFDPRLGAPSLIASALVSPYAARFSGDGRLISYWAISNKMRVYDAGSGAERAELRGDIVLLAPRGARALVSDIYGTARVVDTSTGATVTQLDRPVQTLWGLSWSHDGAYLATLNAEQVELWDAQTRRSAPLQVGGPVTTASFSPQEPLLLLTYGSTAQIWDVAAGRARCRLTQERGIAGTPQWSAAGRFIVLPLENNGAQVWRASDCAPAFTAAGQLVFSPDDRYALASTLNVSGGVSSGRVAAIETATGQTVATLGAATDGILATRFSPDGTLVAIISSSGTLQTWEVGTWQSLATLGDQPAWRIGLDFSPNSKLIAAGTADGTVRIWDARTGAEIDQLDGQYSDLAGVFFSPDGRQIVVAGQDNPTRVYRCDLCGSLADLLALASAHVTRTLTDEERQRYDLLPAPPLTPLPAH